LHSKTVTTKSRNSSSWKDHAHNHATLYSTTWYTHHHHHHQPINAQPKHITIYYPILYYTILFYTILYYTPYTTLECDVQDQEKQRSLERRRREDAERKEEPGRGDRRREEVDGVHKLHARLKQEQQMWDRECLAREKQQVCYAILCYAIIA